MWAVVCGERERDHFVTVRRIREIPPFGCTLSCILVLVFTHGVTGNVAQSICRYTIDIGNLNRANRATLGWSRSMDDER